MNDVLTNILTGTMHLAAHPLAWVVLIGGALLGYSLQPWWTACLLPVAIFILDVGLRAVNFSWWAEHVPSLERRVRSSFPHHLRRSVRSGAPGGVAQERAEILKNSFDPTGQVAANV